MQRLVNQPTDANGQMPPSLVPVGGTAAAKLKLRRHASYSKSGGTSIPSTRASGGLRHHLLITRMANRAW